jgi:hypothetical protein
LNQHDWPTTAELELPNEDDAYNASTAEFRMPARYLVASNTIDDDEEESSFLLDDESEDSILPEEDPTNLLAVRIGQMRVKR